MYTAEQDNSEKCVLQVKYYIATWLKLLAAEGIGVKPVRCRFAVLSITKQWHTIINSSIKINVISICIASIKDL